MFKKIDDYLFNTVQYFVIKWVKKKKYKEHKYDFFIMFQSWETAYWLLIVAYDYYHSYTHNSSAGYILTSLLLVIVVVGETFNYRTLLSQKSWYDTIFLQRKNPIMYQIMKEVCESLRKDGWKYRRITLALNFSFGAFLILVNPKLAPIYIFMIARMYSSYIFDFDEPDKFEKAKEDLTEIEKLSFKNLIKNLAPTKV